MFTNDDDTSLTALERVAAERKLQDIKWGADRNLDDEVWLTVLAEEFGESANAILEHRPISELVGEVVQVAAVAVAWIECLMRIEQGQSPAPRKVAEAGTATKKKASK